MDVFKQVVKAVKKVAPLAASCVVPGSGRLLEGLMRTVTGDPPETPILEVANTILADPAKMVELQRLALDQEVKLAEIDAKKLETVNVTMRGEAKSDKWPQYSWRPFNGFCFPLAVILIYFILPLLSKAVPEIPQWVWIGWLSILGVATWDRGKEKRAKAGEKPKGLLEGAINAIKGSGS